MKRAAIILIMIMIFLTSCAEKNENADKWVEMFKEGKYEELLNETEYSDDPQAIAFKDLALIGLKDFEKLEIKDNDAFFKAIRKLLNYREKIFKGEDAKIDITNSKTKYPKALKVLVEYTKNLENTDLESRMKKLSKAYKEMKEIEEKLKGNLTQTDLIILKRNLNKVFDEEISKTQPNDLRRKLYEKLMKKIDSKMKLISPGIDRPQS